MQEIHTLTAKKLEIKITAMLMTIISTRRKEIQTRMFNSCNRLKMD